MYDNEEINLWIEQWKTRLIIPKGHKGENLVHYMIKGNRSEGKTRSFGKSERSHVGREVTQLKCRMRMCWGPVTAGPLKVWQTRHFTLWCMKVETKLMTDSEEKCVGLKEIGIFYLVNTFAEWWTTAMKSYLTSSGAAHLLEVTWSGTENLKKKKKPGIFLLMSDVNKNFWTS